MIFSGARFEKEILNLLFGQIRSLKGDFGGRRLIFLNY